MAFFITFQTPLPAYRLPALPTGRQAISEREASRPGEASHAGYGKDIMKRNNEYIWK